MDGFDIKILKLLQQDATLSVAEIAERIGLSSTPCWRRIQNLEKAGVIKARVALLDPEALNVGVTVFVMVRTSQHNAAWLEQMANAITGIPEIVEFYRMSGDIDYLLKVVVPDIAGFDAVYKRMIETIDLSDVSSAFAMEAIKDTTVLPLNYVST